MGDGLPICVGRETIQLLARKGYVDFPDGSTLIAASNLLGYDPYQTWRPMNTAPRMTHVLLWLPNAQHVIAMIGHDPADIHYIGYMGDDTPTAWQPLPAPPDLSPPIGLTQAEKMPGTEGKDG